MNKPKFSVALIAKNEALTLPRMIGSLKEFQERGGEIWVLDTGSTDNTIEVAQSLGCKTEAVGDKFRINIDEDLANKINAKFVIEGELPVVKAGESLFDFASARNYIADFPENDMIATPDCDEIYTKLDLDKLDKVISDGAEQLDYEFVFSHDHLGNPIIKFRHCKFYNRKKMKWVGIIHEVLNGAANKMYLGEDVIKLEHYQNEKTNRSGYLKGLAVDCYNNPTNDRNSHYFAREMFYNGGRYKSAIKEFENHISMNRWPTEAAQSMLYIGDSYKNLGNTDEMLKWYTKSVEKEVRREPLMRLAEYYFAKNLHRQVVAYCEAALTVTQLPFYSNHQPYYENVPHELLYISYWWLGNKEKSKEHYLKALAFCPTNQKYISDGKFYNIPTRLDIYANKIKSMQNFTFVKRGDGELACMAGEQGGNCDGHPYSKELGDKLKEAFEFMKDKADIVEWNDQKNYNILLHRTDNDLEKLKNFWLTVKESSRRKFFIGPKRLEEVCQLLGVSFIEVPLINAFEYIQTTPLIPPPEDNDIFVFSCGMPAKVLIAQILRRNPNVTCIDAGSSFDPIFIGNTRTVQAGQAELKNLYFNSYQDPKIEGMMSLEEMNWLYGTSKTVESFLEIGSYKGKSTHAILSGGCPKVYAVDHFVGSSDPIETGNLDTYSDFMKNVGHFKNLNVRKMSSLEAVKEFADKGLDVVFIDGGHRIQEVTEDIVAWLPKAKKIICGHDYNDIKAVRLAVDSLLGPVQVCDRIWYKVLDGTEVLDSNKVSRLNRYVDRGLVNRIFLYRRRITPKDFTP
jgi:glycosyltransferase involved in cell wall biosynthesis